MNRIVGSRSSYPLSSSVRSLRSRVGPVGDIVVLGPYVRPLSVGLAGQKPTTAVVPTRGTMLRYFGTDPKAPSAQTNMGSRPFTRKSKPKSEAHPSPVEFDFRAKAREFIKKARDAIEPMQHVNKDFNMDSSADSLELDLAKHGKYFLQVDYETQMINFQSPVTGRFAYYYDIDDDTWRCQTDNHDLRGLIVRDMMRQNMVGCPDF
jgi:frataxin-like iron-binding protein CyaY